MTREEARILDASAERNRAARLIETDYCFGEVETRLFGHMITVDHIDGRVVVQDHGDCPNSITGGQCF